MSYQVQLQKKKVEQRTTRSKFRLHLHLSGIPTRRPDLDLWGMQANHRESHGWDGAVKVICIL